MKNVNTMHELRPRYDARQSFYKKAHVENCEDGTINLWSYTTNVARITDGIPEVFGTYSPTTLRHIKEFLKQYGYEASSKKQIEEDYT